MSDITADPVRTVSLSPCASTELDALIMKRGGALDRDLGDVLSPRSMRTGRAFAKTSDDTLDGAI